MENRLEPKLRFSEFSGDWEKKHLEKMAKITMGQSPDSASYNENQIGMPLIQGNADITNRISNPRNYTSSPTKTCDIGDVLMTVRAPVGYIAKSIHNACIGRGVCAIKVPNDFIYQYLLAYEDKWDKFSQGSTFTAVNSSDIKGLTLFSPLLPEQQKIASFLSSVDSKIEKLEKKKALLDDYKKGVMQKIFSQEIRFRDEDGKEYPEWVEKRLGEVGKFFSGGTPKSTEKRFYQGDIPFIGSGNISDNSVEKFITEEALNSSSAKIVNRGDLLYALYGATSGEVAISKIEGAINQAVLCIRSLENIEFIYNFLRLNKKNILETYLQGGQGNLSAQIVKNVKINLPCLEEQEKIANFLSGIDQKIELVEQETEQVKEFKKGLLQQMFV